MSSPPARIPPSHISQTIVTPASGLLEQPHDSGGQKEERRESSDHDEIVHDVLTERDLASAAARRVPLRDRNWCCGGPDAISNNIDRDRLKTVSRGGLAALRKHQDRIAAQALREGRPKPGAVAAPAGVVPPLHGDEPPVGW